MFAPYFHVGFTCRVCTRKFFSVTKPLAMGYLWLPFVPPWATYCLVAEGPLLCAVPPKNCQNFSSVIFASFLNRFYLPCLYSETIFATKPLAMGYLWLPIVIWQM